MALTSPILREFINRRLRLPQVEATAFINRLEMLCEDDGVILSPYLRRWIDDTFGEELNRVLMGFDAQAIPRLSPDLRNRIATIFPDNYKGYNLRIEFVNLFERVCVAAPGFKLQFTASPIGDPTDISAWNTYLAFRDSGNNLSNFGSVNWDGDTFLATFYDWDSDVVVIRNTSGLTGETRLTQIDDELGELSAITPSGLSGATSLESVSSASCTTLGNGAFQDSSIALLYVPALTSLGSTAGDDGVFLDIVPPFSTIDVYVPTALSTNNGGGPDGDLAYLTTNYTATINYV